MQQYSQKVFMLVSFMAANVCVGSDNKSTFMSLRKKTSDSPRTTSSISPCTTSSISSCTSFDSPLTISDSSLDLSKMSLIESSDNTVVNGTKNKKVSFYTPDPSVKRVMIDRKNVLFKGVLSPVVNWIDFVGDYLSLLADKPLLRGYSLITNPVSLLYENFDPIEQRLVCLAFKNSCQNMSKKDTYNIEFVRFDIASAMKKKNLTSINLTLVLLKLQFDTINASFIAKVIEQLFIDFEAITLKALQVAKNQWSSDFLFDHVEILLANLINDIGDVKHVFQNKFEGSDFTFDDIDNQVQNLTAELINRIGDHLQFDEQQKIEKCNSILFWLPEILSFNGDL